MSVTDGEGLQVWPFHPPFLNGSGASLSQTLLFILRGGSGIYSTALPIVLRAPYPLLPLKVGLNESSCFSGFVNLPLYFPTIPNVFLYELFVD